MRSYRDCRKLVETAVRVYGHKIGVFDTEDDIKKRVNYIVNRIADSENAICWGVDCTHVARYMDKSFEEYVAESSSSYKILWRLAYAVKNSDHELIYEALNEALEYIESHEEAYDDRQAPPRPGDAPRDPISCFGEARGML